MQRVMKGQRRQRHCYLASVEMPVSAIAEQLGFDESTNFVRFFNLSSDLAPSEFRRQHESIYN